MLVSPNLSKVNSPRETNESLAPPPPGHGEQCFSCCHHDGRVWVYAKVTMVVTILIVIFTIALKAWLSNSDSSEPPVFPERVDGTQSQQPGQPVDMRTTDTPARGSSTQDLASLVLEQLPFGSIVKKTAERVRCHECRKKLPQRTMADLLEALQQSTLDLVSRSGNATGPSSNLCAKCTQEVTRLQHLVKSCSHPSVMSKNIVTGQPLQTYPAAEYRLLINYVIDITLATDYGKHNEVGNHKGLVKVRVILEAFLLNREMSHNTKSLLKLLDTIPRPPEDLQTTHKDPVSGKLSLVNAKTGVQEF